MNDCLSPLSPRAPFPGPLQSLLAEAVALAEDARACIVAERGTAAIDDDPLSSLRRSMALGHLTSRVAFAVAWLLGRRAVACGELTPRDATAPDWRLGGRHLELARDTGDEGLPPALLRLIERSVALHARLERLDAGLE